MYVTPYRALGAEESIVGRSLTEEQVVRQYKLTLANFQLNYKPLVTPSVFALDLEGRLPTRGTPLQMAEQRLCGLSADTQFAPLSAAARRADGERSPN